MYFTRIYYILDTVSETVIGSFRAVSEAMALKLIKAFDFKKANVDPDDIVVVYDPLSNRNCETFTEVKSQNWPELGFKQPVLEFEHVKN